jgi:hypothetical protein
MPPVPGSGKTGGKSNPTTGPTDGGPTPDGTESPEGAGQRGPR